MSLSKKWKVAIPITLIFILGGSAAAFFMTGRRDVTTSSAEAYRCYRVGRENEQKLYEKEAMAAYAEALSYDPGFVMAGVRLASHLMERDPERAKTLFKKVTRCTDGLTARELFVVKLFEARALRRDKEEIGRLINEYAERFPDDPEAIHQRAAFLMKTGKTEEAIAEFERLVEVNPNFAIAYNQLGYRWMEAGDFVKAEDNLKRYRYLAPDQANPYDSLGEMYANIGRYEEAEENLRRALEIKPDFHPALGHLGTMEVLRGNYEAAARYFLQVRDLLDAPYAQADFASYAAFCFLQAGNPTRALELIEETEKLAATVPEDARPYIRRGVAAIHALLLFETQESGKARELLAQAPALPPQAKVSHDPVVLVRGLHEAREALERSDPKPARAVAATGLPKMNASMGGGYPYYPAPLILRASLAGWFLEAGYRDDARALVNAVLAANPRFQMALDIKKKLDGSQRDPGRNSTP